MNAVTVTRIDEEHRSEPTDELLIMVGKQDGLFVTFEEAKKLRDALCIMLGRPGKAGK